MLVLYVQYAKPWQTSGWFSESMVLLFELELCPYGKAYSRRAAWPKLGQLPPFTESRDDESCSRVSMLNPSCPKVVLGLHYEYLIILWIIIMMYHYRVDRVGIFQPKDVSINVSNLSSQWKLSLFHSQLQGVQLLDSISGGDTWRPSLCFLLDAYPPKMSQDVPRCPKMSQVLILRGQTIATVARWCVADASSSYSWWVDTIPGYSRTPPLLCSSLIVSIVEIWTSATHPLQQVPLATDCIFLGIGVIDSWGTKKLSYYVLFFSSTRLLALLAWACVVTDQHWIEQTNGW